MNTDKRIQNRVIAKIKKKVEDFTILKKGDNFTLTLGNNFSYTKYKLFLEEDELPIIEQVMNTDYLLITTRKTYYYNSEKLSILSHEEIKDYQEDMLLSIDSKLEDKEITFNIITNTNNFFTFQTMSGKVFFSLLNCYYTINDFY